MNRDRYFFLFLLAITLQSFAQVAPGARQVALSHSDISLGRDVFMLFNNPAGLAYSDSREAGFYYSPAPYGIKELSNGFGAYIEPATFGSLSAGFMVYGFDLYKETLIAIGFSRKIAKTFLVGISYHYKTVSIKNYGSAGFSFVNIGWIAELSKNFNIGFVFENFTRTTLKDEPNHFPVVYSTGLGYRFSENLQAYFALRKELNYDLSVRFGTEYKIIDEVVLRVGTGTEPNLFSGGIGIAYSFFKIDYAFTAHPELEFTHQFGLIISF